MSYLEKRECHFKLMQAILPEALKLKVKKKEVLILLCDIEVFEWKTFDDIIEYWSNLILCNPKDEIFKKAKIEIASVIKILEDKDLIKRYPSKKDKRIMLFELTSKGKKVVKKIKENL